jgi:acetylglutamate kinase
MNRTLIVKIGGDLLTNRGELNTFFHILSSCSSSRKGRLIIVHGGGSIVDDLMERLSFPIVRKDGLRLTSSKESNFVVGALGGTANKILLAYSRKHNLPAIGLCLADGKSVNVGRLGEEGSHTGYAKPGSPKFINILFSHGFLPIISSIGITEEGQIMNVNADDASAVLATTLDASLVFLSSVKGVLDGKGRHIREIKKDQAEELIKSGIIKGGMKVKVKAALTASRILRREVYIASWSCKKTLESALRGLPTGTRIST